jgi:hypothetical protein
VLIGKLHKPSSVSMKMRLEIIINDRKEHDPTLEYWQGTHERRPCGGGSTSRTSIILYGMCTTITQDLAFGVLSLPGS